MLDDTNKLLNRTIQETKANDNEYHHHQQPYQVVFSEGDENQSCLEIPPTPPETKQYAKLAANTGVLNNQNINSNARRLVVMKRKEQARAVPSEHRSMKASATP